MEDAATDREPDNSSGKGDISEQSPAASGSVAVAAPPPAAAGAGGIQLPVWTKALGWCGVTTTLVALTFIGSRTEFRRALAASTIHDFYNLLARLIFFPLELIWHPLERISGALTNALYGTGWLPDPDRFNFVRVATRPVVDGVTRATSHLSSTLARCSLS